MPVDDAVVHFTHAFTDDAVAFGCKAVIAFGERASHPVGPCQGKTVIGCHRSGGIGGAPERRPDAEQLPRCYVKYDDLIAIGRGADHPDMAIHQQKESLHRHFFAEYRDTGIETQGRCRIQNLADFRARRLAERRHVGQQAFVEFL